MSHAQHDAFLAHARSTGGTKGIDEVLKKWNVDAIIAPADSPYSLLVSAAGYPSATMPLSYLDYNGRPIGMAALTGAYGEGTLFKIMSAWETTFPPRQPPKGY